MEGNGSGVPSPGSESQEQRWLIELMDELKREIDENDKTKTMITKVLMQAIKRLRAERKELIQEHNRSMLRQSNTIKFLWRIVVGLLGLILIILGYGEYCKLWLR